MTKIEVNTHTHPQKGKCCVQMSARYLFLLIILFLPFFSSAQQLSSLTIFSEDGEKFTLFLDGEQKNPQPMAEMRVRELTKPDYTAKVVFENSMFPELTTIIKTLTPRGYKADVTYKITTTLKGEHNIRCIAIVPIKENSQVGNNESSYSGTEGADDHYLEYTGPKSKTTTVTTHTDENGNTISTKKVQLNYDEKGTVQASASGCIPMDQADFERTKMSIEKNEMDDQKLVAAREMGINNCFTSDQVLQILNLFSLEKNKLNFAKFAYAQTVDKANYFKINSVFETEETKKELFEYLSSVH